jgi:hypothetical protein
MEGIISDTLVAFEVDHVDRDTQEAWSVLVRGIATALGEPEREMVGPSIPIPLVPCPGETVFVVRLDVVTGRRFPVERAELDPAARSDPEEADRTSSVTKGGTALTWSDTASPSAP